MQTHKVTTPFGRRPMTLALVRGQLDAASIKQGKSVDKWKVFREVCEARSKLNVQDRALAVLDALLTFLPSNELSADVGLVVFPSNAQLSVRAHGITGTTLRRHLAALVDAGLIVRKDSPNGKRYARRDGAGELEQVFGFSVAPLLSRSEELAALAQSVAADRRRFQIVKENLSLCRRDIRKLISAAMEENMPGDWDEVESQFLTLLARIPRTPTISDLQPILDEMEMLHSEVVNRMNFLGNSEKSDANAVGFERHIQNSNTESTNELEPSSRKEQGEKPSFIVNPVSEPNKAFPLGMVLQACPAIADYGQGGSVGSWRELMTAAVVVRSMLGVSPSAYQNACEVLGAENAAVAIACILERAGQINSAGGYLRDLTARAARGEFSLGPMLMALYRSNAGVGKRAREG